MHQNPDPVTGRLAGSGGGGRRGRGGRGGGGDEADRFVDQAIERLDRERIVADRSFLQSLRGFASDGIGRAQSEGTSAGQIQPQWNRVIDTMVQYSQEYGIRQLNAGAFDGIRSRLCPGFWPFC